jgi:hypothetical protein
MIQAAELRRPAPAMVNWTKLRPWLYLVLIAAVNACICREAFFTEFTGHFQSMHGIWLAMARLGGSGWLRPRWWPYGGGGAPAEYLYAPAIPAATAALAHLLGISLPMALHALTGLVYCLAPVLLYAVSWRLFGAPGYSFAAALAYSLLSPSQLVVPDAGGFHAAAVLGARRLYLLFDWDELPHMTSLALLPVAVFFLARSLERRRSLDTGLAALLMAAMMLANMFGAVLVAMVALTVPLAMERRFHPAAVVRSGMTAVAAYLAVCPWLPPSLLFTIRRNTALDGEADTLPHALAAFLIIAAASAAVWFLASYRGAPWPLRWLLLFACPAVLIPTLAQYWGPHFVPQPGRYKCELELAFAWLGVFALRPLIERFPPRARMVLAAVLAAAAVWQVVSYRRVAVPMLRPVDVARSIEFRSAKWVEANLPGERVMMGGSMGFWLDTFTSQPQVTAPYSTAMNWIGQVATFTFYSDQNAGGRGAEFSLLWLQALGAQAIAIPGPRSPDAWKGFVHPRKFDGVLPVLWSEDDTTIYRVPQVSGSLAHAMRAGQLVRHPPVHGLDVGEVRAYVAALEDPAAPPVALRWQGPDQALVRARLEPADVISTQINYHPGWHARAGGESLPIFADGLGFMAIDPKCSGDCEVTLEFDGGVEAELCWAASAAVLLLALAAATGRARKRVARSMLAG